MSFLIRSLKMNYSSRMSTIEILPEKSSKPLEFLELFKLRQNGSSFDDFFLLVKSNIVHCNSESLYMCNEKINNLLNTQLVIANYAVT